MKYLLIALLLCSGCASSRVLVKDCQKLEGVDLENCVLVRKL
jgi:hypothetical protein